MQLSLSHRRGIAHAHGQTHAHEDGDVSVDHGRTNTTTKTNGDSRSNQAPTDSPEEPFFVAVVDIETSPLAGVDVQVCPVVTDASCAGGGPKFTTTADGYAEPTFTLGYTGFVGYLRVLASETNVETHYIFSEPPVGETGFTLPDAHAAPD